jgi:death-on-curing protein
VTTWINKVVVLAIHDEQLAEHGGPAGTVDENILESALAKPQNRLVYENADLDIIDLAATYALALAQQQSFADGNKRVSAVVTELFLNLNGFDLVAEDAEIVRVWRAIASKSMSDVDFLSWLRGNTILKR